MRTGSGVRAGSVKKNSRAGGFPSPGGGRSLRAACWSAAASLMPDPAFDPVAARAEILRRIALAAEASGRDPDEVTLTAVCKQQPWPRVEAVLAVGQRVFGE